jgi:hypothetical protein
LNASELTDEATKSPLVPKRACITKRWKAQIRRKEYPAPRETLETNSDAQAWARMIESEIDRRIIASRIDAKRTALHQLINR